MNDFFKCVAIIDIIVMICAIITSDEIVGTWSVFALFIIELLWFIFAKKGNK